MVVFADPCDMSELRLIDDMPDPIDAKEPIEKAEAADPTEPMESAEPTEPMDNTEPRLAMQRNESCDQSDHLERLLSDPPPSK